MHEQAFPIEEAQAEDGSEDSGYQSRNGSDAELENPEKKQPAPSGETDSDEPDDGDEEEDDAGKDEMLWEKGTETEDGLRKRLSPAASSRIVTRTRTRKQPLSGMESHGRSEVTKRPGRDKVGGVETEGGREAASATGRLIPSRGRRGLGRAEAMSLGGKRNERKVLSPRGKGFRGAKFLQGGSFDQMWRLMRPKLPPGQSAWAGPLQADVSKAV